MYKKSTDYNAYYLKYEQYMKDKYSNCIFFCFINLNTSIKINNI